MIDTRLVWGSTHDCRSGVWSVLGQRSGNRVTGCPFEKGRHRSLSERFHVTYLINNTDKHEQTPHTTQHQGSALEPFDSTRLRITSSLWPIRFYTVQCSFFLQILSLISYTSVEKTTNIFISKNTIILNANTEWGLRLNHTHRRTEKRGGSYCDPSLLSSVSTPLPCTRIS